jgi:1-aminocyclopropane-1-carboxylate deaminase/D-cysteine desulfhydrase-like pyridoxal-dependent ACC family enzyme|tara:strand:+ start:775 stop:1806 length:1032 start_codon:yes stop_codon:yes gene_type:complete
VALSIEDLHSIQLGAWPTPLRPNPTLGQVVGIPDLWIKRDDLTGFSWGGNKVRAVEYLIADALRAGATEVVLAGGPSSNFAAVMAAAARSVGLGAHQVSYGSEPTDPVAALIAARSVGAQVHFTESPHRAEMETMATSLGRRRVEVGAVPYVVPRGGASDVGALGFIAAAIELDKQADETSDVPTTIVIPLGSGGSTAGLVAGLCCSHRNWKVHAVSVSRAPEDIEEDIVNKSIRCAALAGVTLTSAAVTSCLNVHDGRNPGFGKLSAEQERFATEMSTKTGLLIDPTYNAKTLFWLRDASLNTPILYWHTGGSLGALDFMLSSRRRSHRESQQSTADTESVR